MTDIKSSSQNPTPQKKTKGRKRAAFFLYSIFIGGFLLFCSFQFPKVFQQTWGRVFKFVPGQLAVEYLQFNFFSGKFVLKNASYQLPNGHSLLKLNHIDAQANWWSSLFKLRVMFSHFNVEGLHLDLSELPPSKKKSNLSELINNIMKRLGIKSSQILDTQIQLKNANLIIPQASLVYIPNLLGKDSLQLKLNQVGGEVLSKVLKVEELSYEGSFALSNSLKNALLFEDAKGLLKIKGASLGQFNFSDLETEATLKEERIEVENFELKMGESAFLLNLSLAPIEQQMKGTLKTKEWISLMGIPGLSSRVAQSYAKVNAQLDFDLLGLLPSEMEGKVKLLVQAKENFYNPENNNLKIEFEGPFEKGVLGIQQLQVEADKTKFGTHQGNIDFKNMKLDVPIGGNGFDLRTFIAMLSDLEIHGYVDFEGKASGSLKKPDFVFNAKASNTGYKFLRFGLSEGKFQIVDGVLSYVGSSPSSVSYQTSVNVQSSEIYYKDRKTILKSSFSNLDASSLMENPELTGKIQGTFDLNAFHEDFSGKAKANIDDLKFYQFHLGATEVEGDLSNGHFKLPFITIHPPAYKKVQLGSDTHFEFDNRGFKVSAKPLSGMTFDGSFAFDKRDFFKANIDCQNCDLEPLMSLLDYSSIEGSVSGTVAMNLFIGNTSASTVDSKITSLVWNLPEESLRQNKTLSIGYRNEAFHFDDVVLDFKQSNLKVEGSYKSDSPTQATLDLGLKGTVDLGLLSVFKSLVRESSGLADVNLKITGDKNKPQLLGEIKFDSATLAPRILGNTLENLQGKLMFEKNRLDFQNLKGSVLDGELTLSGPIWYEDYKIQKADLNIDAREIGVSEPGAYKMIVSGKLGLSGEDNNLLLAGNLDVTEGRYIKKFDIKDYILKPATVSEPAKPSALDDLKLDIKVKSPGELAIKNNIAELYLKSDLQVEGTYSKPHYQGALEILDGNFHYFKINFENAKGVIDYRDIQKNEPHVDIVAEKLFERTSEDIRVQAKIEGYADNLQLSFTSDPILEKREILALIFTGSLPDEGRLFSGSSLASSVLASQLTSVLEGPVGNYTSLDVFRLEASDPDSKSLTSLVVGKKLTERLSLEFKTDLSLEESIKSVQAEYLFFDNLLLKGARSTNGRYRLELTLRFKGY